MAATTASVASAVSAVVQEPLTRIANDLRSRNEELRLKAAAELLEYVQEVSRELVGDAFTKFINDVNRRILELIHSPDSNDKIGGILAMDKLIDYDGVENTTKITRFANYLRNVLPGNEPQITVLACKALGRLALTGGTLTAEFVEFEVKRALEWLQGDRVEQRRFAAVLILREFANNAPTLIYSYVPQILDLIWVALRDTKINIREGGAEALGACLALILQRESTLRTQWYKKLYDEAQKGLKGTTIESVHGSLLALNEMIIGTGRFMDSRYHELVETVLRFREHKELVIRKSVSLMLPALASYDSEIFVKDYLAACMQFLLVQLKKEKERGFSFVAIGKIAIAVGSHIAPYLDGIVVILKESLVTKNSSKARTATEESIFQCISMLAIAVGQALTKYMHDLLDQMFATGLSEPLRQALVDLVKYIPPLLSAIQERLLNMLSSILCGQPYRHPGAPSRAIASTILNTSVTSLTIPADARDFDTIILALNTLGSFDFSGHMLHELIRDCALVYLEDENSDIRKAAAVTTCQLLIKDSIAYQTSSHAMNVVGEILEKLLTVGITDPDPIIRQTVLQALDERFDHHLAQAEHVRSLFIALNDEVFTIRELAITIIGRLTMHNPAYVMPSLRKTLIQLLTELEYSAVARNKEESAKLISHLIAASQRLIKPYVEPIVKVLLPKAKDASPGVAAQIMNAIGELAVVGGEDLLPYVDEFLPMIIETLQDQSSTTKREAALKTLGLIACSTGYVIDPYLKYPTLLNILIHILKTEQNAGIRRETVKLMGTLGALDPYRHKMASQKPDENIVDTVNPDLNTLSISPSNEDYYPTVAISALMRILRDTSLSTHHTAVIQAVMYIFKTLGLKCVPFLPQILPPFLSMMKTCAVGMLEFYFQQLSALVTIVRQHIRNYLTEIFELIQQYWNPNSTIQITILSLIEAIATALDGEFKVYLPTLLPQILQILEVDSNEKRLATQKALHAMIVFGNNLEEYLHLVVPAIVKLFERVDVPLATKKYAIQVAGTLTKKVNFSDQASRIIHPLVRVLSSPHTELKTAAMDTLSALVYQLSIDFAIFVPMINKAIIKNHIQHPKYEMLVSKLLKNEPLPREFGEEGLEKSDSSADENLAEAAAKKLPVNQQQLRRAWEASQRSTKDDWYEWVRRFSVELLKESPSHALRACANLASIYYPLARELFNAGFVSCWSELYDQFQDELVRSLETALTSPNIPAEILQTLLNLAEFMEHDDKALPIDIRTLGAYAAKCHAYAKALHYKELEFMSEPLTNTIESLISINNQLQQPDSAVGILTYAQQHHDVELKESWYEKLQRWEDALGAYEARQKENPSAIEITLGRMRCLHALGEWEALSSLAQEKWDTVRDDHRKGVAPLAAAAAWGLGHWDLMDEYLGVMKQDTPDGAFFRALLSLHRNLYPQALSFINRTRDLLDTELTALVGESYNRAYTIVVRVQMLAELEEIIAYKQLYDQPERQASIRNTWMKRLKGCQRNVEVWQRILKVRSLVISQKEDMDMWIKFANLCQKSGRLSLSQKTLLTLLEGQDKISELMTANNPPQLVYAYLKHRWSSGNRDDAYRKMNDFSKMLMSQLGFRSVNDINLQMEFAMTDPKSTKLSKLLARSFLKIGEWHTAMQDELSENSISDVLRSYLASAYFDKDWYKAWHAWALANFEALSFYEKKHEAIPQQVLIAHAVPAIQGFFRSISLSKGNSLQDTLRLLTLWFKYGYQQDVNLTIGEGFNNVSIDTWLQVIPQLIARIHSSSPHVRRLIHQLLSDVGKRHPQALVYSLTVASKSQSVPRKKAALAIMDKMRNHSASLVEQALLVSQELIRVAILWHEMWHEGLEEASRLYFGDHNVEGMFATLEPLHQMLERGPETLREISFNQAFGRDLQEALDWCRKYKRTLNVNDLNQAWDLYYHVFRRINKQLPQLTTLELQYVSPKLLAARDLDLAVPGTYKSGEQIIRIASFAPTLSVITSKQRPRKLSIKGSDGKDYQYLLKGHEDLRQDERVMQLFGLVNTLLSTDSETFKRHLSIQRYPVIPLSPNSGLIGWVPHCDTLHALIRDYRESRKILLNIEHRLMLQMAPDYDNLTLLQKVEVFEYALENTTGQDLYKVLWLKSKNSEVWLERRTNYTRSLAVMSMVGYILGLGDRHPSNLMLDRYSGKVIHIDFGDCFEVAMHREKFPEKIPFRLTRMLINAMEVSGIEGNFRITCENVMRVLRENKDSLMAVLEAFVYDPLINWRLMTNPSPKQDKPAGTAAGGANANRGANKFETELLDDPARINPLVGRKLQLNENDLINQNNGPEEIVGGGSLANGGAVQKPEGLNSRAVTVINRVQKKLTGKDFKVNTLPGNMTAMNTMTNAPLPNLSGSVPGLKLGDLMMTANAAALAGMTATPGTLDVPSQVQKLILQATSLENLCQCYIGWCAFW